MSADIDCVVIGAGVVGLAIARALAQSGREVLVAEATEAIGTGTSSRNSEVIHAGIYYPAGSLKARLCVRGKHLLYAYCAERGIPHKRLGKLIVATSAEQAAQLEGIAQRARANGVDDLQFISGEDAMRLEPALRCTAALVSPSTGIVDSHALMLAYQGDAENAGAQCVFHTPLVSGRVRPEGGFDLQFGGDDAMSLSCNVLINSAGLQAPALARRIEGVPAASIPTDYLCKGSYFTLSGRAPFSHLIYPVPQHAGLGVHLTLDMGGQAKFGPDTEWVGTEDYTIDPARAEVFYAAVRSYWPALPDDALAPGYTGIRPKISGPHEPAADFVIAGPAVHGVRGLVNLFGIESPGLTSSLALAEETLARLADDASSHPSH
ncbi:NAD(P)/FAD-dependent oxidoreductase [Achromobacter ruhlandii]|uniref:NAD(P)/FAD-dependent oxidoreductase n=1 Tax=Achromobacter ruhlandii TaxID=72557 RepID=UPI0006C553E2|nr:NAD(P)/FAD-dependent oxidoreductase [Achromobacter ruhlandii]AVC42393.1 NAD(P)/FAD-dependent oxidoreductase [Achromobacter xylosoxidans]CUI53157.1 L-2-hydroxyglutarate oxidase LhgO [Achromobacter ruhlandii]CUI62637.1 L-2-hydroxyglutarate oxidase LhgO [Achromobacter ruhlandii]CUK14410.1 L-2-hydroxyglutarate oxidase LhgO [Achromobacter ruhlandii]